MMDWCQFLSFVRQHPWIFGQTLLTIMIINPIYLLSLTRLWLVENGLMACYSNQSGSLDFREMKGNQFTVCHYLPHRGLVRNNHETTKMRIVFDASAKRKGHPSLKEECKMHIQMLRCHKAVLCFKLPRPNWVHQTQFFRRWEYCLIAAHQGRM